MRCVTIENTDLWRIDSYGNGTSYTFTHKPSGDTGHVQGDDANSWRDDYDAMATAYESPGSIWYGKTWNACLTELCAAYVCDA